MLSKTLLGFSVPDNQPSMTAHYKHQLQLLHVPLLVPTYIPFADPSESLRILTVIVTYYHCTYPYPTPTPILATLPTPVPTPVPAPALRPLPPLQSSAPMRPLWPWPWLWIALPGHEVAIVMGQGLPKQLHELGQSRGPPCEQRQS